MAAEDDLREVRAQYYQAVDNLLSDLQCSEERFAALVRDYMNTTGRYAQALFAAKDTVNHELSEAYEEDAKRFMEEVKYVRLINVLMGYRQRLGFSELKGKRDENGA